MRLKTSSVLALASILALTGCGLFKKTRDVPEPEPDPGPARPEPEVEDRQVQEEPPAAPESDDPPLGVQSLGGPGAKKAFLDSKEGLIALTKAKGNTKRIGKARAQIQEALEADPTLPEAHYNLARALSREGDQAAAADALVKAMQVCFPCTTQMEQEADLEALRHSDQWQRVQESRTLYQGAWERALDSPGVFLLLGQGRMVRDKTWGSVEKDRRDRGRVCFYHAATDRLLPLGLGRDVAGFVLDRDNDALHALKWARFHADTDVGPATLDGMAVLSVDLASFEVTRTRIAESVSGAGLWVQEGRAMVRFLAVDEIEGEETWFTAAAVDGKLTDRQEGDSDYTPTSVDPMSDREWDKICEKRTMAPDSIEDYFYLDAALCGVVSPPVGGRKVARDAMTCASVGEDEALCHPAPPEGDSDGYQGQHVVVLVDARGETHEIAKPDMVVQMAVP